MKSKQTFLKTCTSLFVLSLLLLGSCQDTKTDCPCEDPKEVKKPDGIIEFDQAADLFKNYTETRSPLIENYEREVRSDTSFIPTRYTAFSFKVLKQYLDYIEQEAKSAEVEIETVRIYLGTYDLERLNSPGHNTVFLVPTTNFNRVDRAFEIVEENGKSTAKAIPMDFGTGLKGVGMFMDQGQRQYATFGPMTTSSPPVQGNKSLVLNDGSTAPPPYH